MTLAKAPINIFVSILNKKNVSKFIKNGLEDDIKLIHTYISIRGKNIIIPLTNILFRVVPVIVHASEMDATTSNELIKQFTAPMRRGVELNTR